MNGHSTRLGVWSRVRWPAPQRGYDPQDVTAHTIGRWEREDPRRRILRYWASPIEQPKARCTD